MRLASSASQLVRPQASCSAPHPLTSFLPSGRQTQLGGSGDPRFLGFGCGGWECSLLSAEGESRCDGMEGGGRRWR